VVSAGTRQSVAVMVPVAGQPISASIELRQPETLSSPPLVPLVLPASGLIPGAPAAVRFFTPDGSFSEVVGGFEVTSDSLETVVPLFATGQDQLGSGTVHGHLELYPSSEVGSVQIDQRQVPLEVEYTASLAYMLTGVPVWEFEYGGFLRGGLLEEKVPSRLVALEPYQSGRIPVVFVHGTASSPVRWAEMLNDLRSDPRIRDHFQFWFFSYPTGFPYPLSAAVLRKDLDAINARYPDHKPIVVLGHSMGGMISRTLITDSGMTLWNATYDKPPAEMPFSDETRKIMTEVLILRVSSAIA